MLDAQAREICLNVADYFKREAEFGKTLLPLHSYQKRAAAATGISPATLRKLESGKKEIMSEKCIAREVCQCKLLSHLQGIRHLSCGVVIYRTSDV